MNDKITTTSWQFEARLSDFADRAVINGLRCEIFSLWAAGWDEWEIAKFIAAHPDSEHRPT